MAETFKAMGAGGLIAAAALSALALIPAHGRAASMPAAVCGPQTFTVYFDEWKSALNADGRAALTAHQRAFAGCEITHVRIVGLAGAKGGAHDNQKLSEDRARTIADLLVAGGWARDKLETVALGDKNAKVGDLDKPIRRQVRVEVQARPLRA
jgi:outer membrane protein OmpA-like peptidoglycan-associated protein